METDLLKAYVQFKANPENDDKKDTAFLTWAGISVSDLQTLKKSNPSWASDALKLRRELYAEHLINVDKALFAAAKAGNTKAAELVYRRFEGWSPTLVEQNNHFYNFADLVKSLKEPGKKRERKRTGPVRRS